MRLSVPIEWERLHAIHANGGSGLVEPPAPARRSNSIDTPGVPFGAAIPEGGPFIHSSILAASPFANSLETLSSSTMQSMGAVQHQQALLYALAQAQQQTVLLHQAMRRSDNSSSHTGSAEASSLHSTTSDTVLAHPGASMAGEWKGVVLSGKGAMPGRAGGSSGGTAPTAPAQRKFCGACLLLHALPCCSLLPKERSQSPPCTALPCPA